MKKKILLAMLMIVLITLTLFPQKFKYFRLDKIVTVSGKMLTVKIDTYSGRKNFMVLKLKDQNHILYRIEVSPGWFYKANIIKDDFVQIKGSLNIINKNNIILRKKK
jgi:hypothetical protein